MSNESSSPADDRDYDVFVSYARADGAWVERLAENLHHAGLEVFLDVWEIDEGDVFVHALDRGLARARIGILVVSPTSLSRPWVQQEYAALLSKAVVGSGRLIPVLLKDTELPPLLGIRNYLDFRHLDGPEYEARVKELIQTLKSERRGPPPRKPGKLIPPPGSGYRAEGPFARILRIDRQEAVLLGGAEELRSAIPGDVTVESRIYELERELQRRGAELLRSEMGDPAAVAGDRLHGRQLEVGAALGRAFLPARVAEALRTTLDQAERAGAMLRLGLEVEDNLLSLPWETLRLPAATGEGSASEPLALHPRVSFHRAVRGLGPTPAIQIPGPLRILVALGSPEAQNARGELLDMEAELGRILDAVEPARKAGRPAHVRILEQGTLAEIREALIQERYHVLHISCHAEPGALILEDDDGQEIKVDAERLWSEALPGDRGVPLVVLAGCSTAVGDADEENELPGLAWSLLARGVPAVVAMRVSVSDRYATALAGAFYRALATAEEPRVLAAFAEARRGLEVSRQKGAERAPRPEWSTPLLFLRGEGVTVTGARLYDPDAEFAKIEPPRMVRLAAGVVSRRVGEFVGRRGDQRKILAALRNSEMAGVLIRGLGGVGKSTLLAQLAEKLVGEGWRVISQFGRTEPEGILEALGLMLLKLPESDPRRGLANLVRERKLDPTQRFEILAEQVLEQLPVLILLDNFEDNLTPVESGNPLEFRDANFAAFLAGWLARPGRSRLLVTCRHPLPLEGLAARKLRDHHLGPLSFSETRKLLWRLPGLDALDSEEQMRAYAAVGGHPRTLEYLDALLRGGEARFPDVAERLEAAIKGREGIDDPGKWMASLGDRLDEALATAVTLAADDVLLESLLERLAPVPLAKRLLVGASVYRVPVPEVALVWQVGEVPGLPREGESDPFPEVPAPEGWMRARRQLEELGLLAPADHGSGDLFAVHRWTAFRLWKRVRKEELKEAHRRAALFWRWHCAAISKRIGDLIEARHHHHRAAERDEAVRVTEGVCLQFQTWGMYQREERLIQEVLTWVPEESEKAAASFHQLGNIAFFCGDYERALENYRKAIEIFDEISNRAGMANSYHQLGIVDQQRGNLDQALTWYRKSLELSEEVGNRAGMANSYHQMGTVDQQRENLDQALDWYHQALEIDEELGNRANMATSYHQLGRIAQQRGNLDKALDWYYKTLEIDKESGNRAGLASSYGQLGIVDRERGNFDQALTWFRKALEIFEEIGNRAEMANSISQIGVLFTEFGRAAEAVSFSLRSLAIRLELQIPAVGTDLHWLDRQRAALGNELFHELLYKHLGSNGAEAVLGMLERTSAEK